MTVVFLLITIFFVLCFYFKTLFLTFIFGGALILIVEKLADLYKMKTGRYAKRWKRNLYGYTVLTILLIVTILMIGSSLEEIAVALGEINTQGQRCRIYT